LSRGERKGGVGGKWINSPRGRLKMRHVRSKKEHNMNLLPGAHWEKGNTKEKREGADSVKKLEEGVGPPKGTVQK